MPDQTRRQQRHDESPVEVADHDDWNAEVLGHGPARTELNGVQWTWDSVTVGSETNEGTLYAFASDNHIHTKVKAVDIPTGLSTWIDEHTDGFGNLDA